LQSLNTAVIEAYFPEIKSKGPHDMQLILDKIKIPNELPRILRPRLLSELRLALGSCTSTIITGRAGTGKSLLAADFALTCQRQVAWYKVDAPDADRRLFFRYLAESVCSQRPDFAVDSFMKAVNSTSPDEMPTLAESFIFELQENWHEPLLIVIDDLHLVYDSDWAVPFFCRLLPLLPREVHVLLIGRSMPPAPLWRMRSKQTLNIVDEASLAFSRDEAKELFTSYGLSVDQANVAHKQTRGRAFTLDTRAQLLAATEALSQPRHRNISEFCIKSPLREHAY